MKMIPYMILVIMLMTSVMLGSGCDKSCEEACQKACTSHSSTLYEEMKAEYGSKLENLNTTHCTRACEGFLDKKGIESETCKSYLAE